jgi:hypothetical protein
VDIEELFNSHDGREVGKWPHYFFAYERHFERFRNEPCLIFEIGVWRGGSLQIWKNYFGSKCKIVGIDIISETLKFEEQQIYIKIGNQNDKVFLAKLIEEFGAPDIVIDDGSHFSSDIYQTFSFLYPLMSDNGVYMIEDIHTNYVYSYGKRSKSFIEKSKDLINQLNGHHIHGIRNKIFDRWKGKLTAFTDMTQSITFYDSLVVFDKQKMPARVSEKYPKS